MTLVIAVATSGFAQSTLDKASVLQKQGKFSEARDLYHQAAAEYRASGNQAYLAIALGEAGNISIQLGDYPGAVRDVEEAIKLREVLHQDAWMSEDFTTVGLAYYYMGNFSAALENYQHALSFDRLHKDAAGEATRLNNIGNIYYFQGQYVTALENYQAALKIVTANSSQPWNASSWKLTIGNIATLYQRLGLDEQALALYQQLSSKPEQMPANEYAQILSNEGVLYRHLGDPVKALETYHKSQMMFRAVHHSDGEISVLRNIGIAKAMDFGDLRAALAAFAAALRLSQQSSNSRGIVEANLYMGEVLRRLREYKEATSHLTTALNAAQTAGLVEQQWKALYALGQVAEQTGSAQVAVEDYRKAISIIESVRAGIGISSLRTDFLADRHDVYDSLIAFESQQPNVSADELLGWMERSRARTLQDRVVARTPLKEANVAVIQSHLPSDTVLVEFWMGSRSSLAVWITATESGIVRYGEIGDIRAAVEQLQATIQIPGDQWKKPSQKSGSRILAGIPIRRHLIAVQDSQLNIPFEVLAIPGSQALVIEQSDVSYLPSARLIALPETSRRPRLFPWNREMVALGDPPVYSTDALAGSEQWQSLPASAEEVRSIARVIPGRAEIHMGADARKVYLLNHRLDGVPFLHLSTHALVDMERPDRSRILLASDSPLTADYLFLPEVNQLDLNNVDLVTLSACDTAQGKMVAGEGVQAFSQSFLSAGASATLTSMWRVADAPTANFMRQFYYFLAHGATKAEALQAAKLQFLRSNSALSSPRYWAGFVLNGDGWDTTVRVISWSMIFFVLCAILTAIGLALWLIAPKAVKKAQRTGLESP